MNKISYDMYQLGWFFDFSESRSPPRARRRSRLGHPQLVLFKRIKYGGTASFPPPVSFPYNNPKYYWAIPGEIFPTSILEDKNAPATGPATPYRSPRRAKEERG